MNATGRFVRGRGAGEAEERPVIGTLVPRKVLDDLGVALGARAEGDQLQALVSRLECARDRRANPDGVELADLLHLVVELHSAGARDNDVDLLRLLVAVGEGMPPTPPHLLERDPDLLRAQVAMGKTRPLDLAEALGPRHVL